MPDLNFKIVSAQAIKATSIPTLGFHLEINNEVKNVEIQETDLVCQAWIDPGTFHTGQHAPEGSKAPQESIESSSPISWDLVKVPVKPFKKRTFVMILFPCKNDLRKAIDEYIPSFQDGIIPIRFSFKGSVVYRKTDSQPEVYHLPSDYQVDLKMPISVWRNLKSTHLQKDRKFSAASQVPF